MFELSVLGFGPYFEQQLADPASDEGIPARIAAEHRGAYEVWARAGSGMAQLAGRLLNELKEDAYPGVGDWVILKSPPGPGCTTIIDRVLDRRTGFVRGAAGRETRGQVVAANVDLVFVVCGLDADYSPRRIERYLARIWASGAEPAVLLNKADICPDAQDRTIEVEGHCPGVDVYPISALHSRGLSEIRALIRPGCTAAFVGSSGAGKSTLVNALLGEQRMATGEVRARDGRGCHVTSHRQLVLLPDGGLVLDTPGMRELQLTDEDGLDAVFSEIAELAESCRFSDCRHDSEPGCAVRQAVDEGRLPVERLLHFHKLQQEARAYELRHNEHLRRKSERVWGQLYDEVKMLRRKKRGQ